MLTLEGHLKELSVLNEDNLKLYNSWEVLKIQIKNKLETVSNYFPHFSLHDASHSKTICQQIERFLGQDRIIRLSVSDTWMMLMVFYSHDLGMALKYNDIIDFFYSDEFKNKLLELTNSSTLEISNAARRLAKFEKIDFDKSKGNKEVYEKSIDVFNDVLLIIETCFREKHAIRSTKYIDELMEKFNINNFINIRFITLLNEICIKHQQDIEKIIELPYMTNGLSDDYLHPRFIAGMLCLGDLLDLDTDRFNEYILESSSPLPSNSKLHLEKHKSIKQFLVTPSGIEIESDTPDINVFRIVREWIDLLTKTTNFLAMAWKNVSPDDYGYAPIINFSKITINGSNIWAGFSNLEFTISKSRAIELLQGANIYYDKFIFIREIIQNSIDTSLIQLWTDLKVQDPERYNKALLPIDIRIAEYEKLDIRIKIFLLDNSVVIEITDKGTGISSDDLKVIAKVGAHKSLKRKMEIDSMPNWLKPSGAFGLGLQSIFMVADSFEMITKTDDEPPKKITLESGNSNHGFISVEEYSGNISRGTKVIVRIDEEKIKNSDLGIYELDLNMQPKAVWIWREIFLQLTSDYYKRKNIGQENYFKISLETKNPITNENKELLLVNKIVFNEHIQQLFDGCLTGNSNDEKVLLLEYFDIKCMCLSRIAIPKPVVEIRNGSRIIPKAVRYNRILGNSIYYKNILVGNRSALPYSLQQNRILKYIDFSLNIFDQNADDLLTIGRNNIKHDAQVDFEDIIYNAIEHVIKKLIDKIIEAEDLNSQFLISLYQLCLYYTYRVEDFLHKFTACIKEYLYGLYTVWNPDQIVCKGEQVYTFDQLNNMTMNLIVENKYLSLLNEEAFETVKLDNGECYLNADNSEDRYSDNIISHDIVKITVKRYGGKIFYCKVLRPFRIKEDTVIIQKDEVALLDDFIESIDQNNRSIENNYEFQTIATEEFVFEEEYGTKKRIQLPFSVDQNTYLKQIIISDKYDSFDKDKFCSDLFKTKYYCNVIEYVSKMNHLEIGEVDKQYKIFINKYLDLLLIKLDYRAYIKAKIEHKRMG